MRRPHIDISLTEKQDSDLKQMAKSRNMSKTQYARWKIFSINAGSVIPGQTEEPEEEQYLSIKEFATMANISVSYARKLCKNRQLDHYQFGRLIRIKKEQAAAFIKANNQMDGGCELPPEMARYLNTEQASEFLIVTRATVHKLIKKGKIPAGKINGRYYILKDDLEEYVRTQRIIGATV